MTAANRPPCILRGAMDPEFCDHPSCVNKKRRNEELYLEAHFRREALS